MNEISRLKRELKSLLKTEMRFRRAAKQVAKPYEKCASRTHVKWVRTYKKLQKLDRPKTLDDAFGESTLHGCNPCH